MREAWSQLHASPLPLHNDQGECRFMPSFTYRFWRHLCALGLLGHQGAKPILYLLTYQLLFKGKKNAFQGRMDRMGKAWWPQMLEAFLRAYQENVSTAWPVESP